MAGSVCAEPAGAVRQSPTASAENATVSVAVVGVGVGVGVVLVGVGDCVGAATEVAVLVQPASRRHRVAAQHTADAARRRRVVGVRATARRLGATAVSTTGETAFQAEQALSLALYATRLARCFHDRISASSCPFGRSRG